MLSVCEGFKFEGLNTESKPHTTKGRDSDDEFEEENNDFQRTKLKLKPTLYRTHFYNKEHKNFCSPLSPFGPILVSIKKEGDYYRVLLYTENGGVEHVLTPKWTISRPWYMYLLGQEPTPRHIYTSLKPELTNYILPQMGEEMDKAVQDDLIKVYEPEFSAQIKIGVLYCKSGQTTEQEMLSNTEADESPAFKDFLSLLGSKIPLQGFTGYAGGLDTARNSSGTHSVYTQFMNSEFMYHISTLLPHSATDAKQIEKKKHIGNDRLVIVFKDDDQPFVPTSFKTKQTQVFIVVQPAEESDPQVQQYIEQHPEHVPTMHPAAVAADTDHMSVQISIDDGASSSRNNRKTMMLGSSRRGGVQRTDSRRQLPTRAALQPGARKSRAPQDNRRSRFIFKNKSKETDIVNRYYKIGIATRDEVPPCDPIVPDPPVFFHSAEFRSFLLTKMSNGMLAMRYSTVFETKTQREKNAALLSVLHKYQSQAAKAKE